MLWVFLTWPFVFAVCYGVAVLATEFRSLSWPLWFVVVALSACGFAIIGGWRIWLLSVVLLSYGLPLVNWVVWNTKLWYVWVYPAIAVREFILWMGRKGV